MKKTLVTMTALAAFAVTTTLAIAQDTTSMFQRLDRDNDGFVELDGLSEGLRVRIKRLDANNDGRISSDEASIARKTAKNKARAKGGAQTNPTIADIAYSDAFDRSKLDIWLPEDASGEAPIVVFFHGGGFVGGDKRRIKLREFVNLPKRGVAFASVNYPLKRDIKADSAWGHLPTVFAETQKSLDFIRSKADEWGIDPERIVLAGSSAGTVISQYLAYAKNEDVEAVLALQTPYGIELVIDELSSGAPEMFFYTLSGPTDKTHHPSYAQELYDQCEKVGMECHLYGSRVSGLPQLKAGETIVDVVAKQLNW
ncbi:MAG: alpha/beta hydrolase fold domain-containing protein [Pseudomonadota bacterium]